MDNVLGRRLWSICEDLKNENKIGFLTDDEFEKYFLGFLTYKYLSEKLEAYVNILMGKESLSFEEAYRNRTFKDYIMRESIENIGYFLRPELLFDNIVSSKNYGTIIIQELEKALNEISESSRGTESEEDFLNLFEGVDLNASQLGKSLGDKNKVVFDILYSISDVDFDLDRKSKKFSNNYKSDLSEKMEKKFNEYASIEAENFNEIEAFKSEDINMNLKAIEYDNNIAMDDGSFNFGGSIADSGADDFYFEEYIDEDIGSGFEYLLNQFSLNSSNSIDYYTPNAVSRLITELISSQKSHIRSVYDPCCGSASLLLEIKKELDCDFICGQEINTSFYNIARENMIMHNIHYKNFDIKQGDTLEQPQHLKKIQEEKYLPFEAIVSEIPFNSQWASDKSYLDDVRFREYNILAPRTKADYAFIQHMLYHLADDGIMIVVAPHGVLFRSAAEGVIREYIVNDLNCLDAVIGLPANMFYSTNIPTCIMIFKKNRSLDDDVLFIDASKEFNNTKLINHLRKNDISKIVETYKNRIERNRYSYRASLEEIKENDYNLNIPRYVDTYERKGFINEEDLVNSHKFYKQEIEKVTEEIKQTYKELNLENKLF